MRRLLWLPCAVVLVLSLFAPEITCIATHLFTSRDVVLGKYHIRTPLTCFVVTGDHNSFLWTFSAPGIARLGVKKYLRREVPVAEMSLYPVEHPEQQLDKNVPLEGETIRAKYSIRFGRQTMNCWDLIHHNKFVGSSPTDPAIADIACSTESDDFYAHFSGWRHDASAFLDTLKRVSFAD